MSKADAVDKEHDRMRVLIQITQNLVRVRCARAFRCMRVLIQVTRLAGSPGLRGAHGACA
jgi:hypothetical protein